MGKRKLQFNRIIKGILSVALSGAIAVSGFAGSVPAYAEKTERETFLGYLDDLTPQYIKNQTAIGVPKTASDLIDESRIETYWGGDFEIEPFEVGDTPQVINKKILTQSAGDKIQLIKYSADSANMTDVATDLHAFPNKANQSISKAWAELFCLAERSDAGSEYGKLHGIYRSALYYGDNPIDAFNSAVENETYLTNKNYSRDKEQITRGSSLQQKYIRAAVKYGDGNTVFSDINSRYTTDDPSCYCMIVVNNIKGYTDSESHVIPGLGEKLKADFDAYNSSAGKGGKSNFYGRPYIYVLFFHDFGAENREGEYTVTLSGNETKEELEKMGITCEAKDVKSTTTYENKDENGSADLYAAENNTASTATVTKSISVEEGSSKSITQECEYSKAFSNEFSTTASMTYKMEVSALGVTMGTEMGFSATDTAAWSWTSSRMDGKTEEKSNVETHSQEYSLDMPPYTRSTIIAQPTQSTIKCKYNTMVSPTYKVDALLYDSYFEAPFNNAVGWQDSDRVGILVNRPVMGTTLTNPNGYKSHTVDDLFKTAIVSYSHGNSNPTPALKWTEDIVDRGDHEAAILLGSMYFNRPVLPSGGEFAYTKKGVKISSTEFEPTLPLSLIKPSVTSIDMAAGETYNLEELDVEGLNYMSAPFYGFNKNTSGEWRVKDGYEDYAEIAKNSAGNIELKAKKDGQAVIWYVPTKVDSKKLSQDIDIKGITLNIGKKGGTDPSEGEKEKEKAKEQAAEKASEKGMGAVEDTVVLPSSPGSGKKIKLVFEETPSENAIVTVAKGNVFYIQGEYKKFKSDSKKKVSVNKKGKVTAKKATGSTPAKITFETASDGTPCTLVVNVLDPADTANMEVISGNSVTLKKKMKINAKTSDTVMDISMKGVPLNAEVSAPIDKKGATSALPGNKSIFIIGRDGHYHLAAQIQKKGTVKIPLKINGKKFTYTLKIKEAK